MTERQSIDPILKPRSIAVIGASREPDTIGNQIVRNLIEYGFKGAVYPVNPNATAIWSIPAVPAVSGLPNGVDLAVIAVPKQHVVAVAEACGERGVRGLVVISAGFREVGGEGITRERALMAIVRRYDMRMVGPNCMGVLNTADDVSMNATFADVMPPAGSFAFMSQSGALGLSVLDYAQEYGIGISQFVSIGNKPDVSGNDLLLQWEHDDDVSVILMYVENFGNPRRFLEIAGRVTRTKPIIALKAGRSRIGAKAAASHTGALAASDVAVDALLAQAGVLRASSMEELFDIAIAFGARALPRSRRTAVLTNAGGPGILAADSMSANELDLPALDPTTTRALSAVLPVEASLHNPLDMIASAQPASYRVALEALLADPGIDAAVAIFVPPMGVRQQDVAEAIVAAAATTPEKPVVSVLMGRNGLPQGRSELQDAGIPAYIFPESAARGLAALNRYREWLARVELPEPELTVDAAAASRIIDDARAAGRRNLDQHDAIQLLATYGIPVVETLVAKNADDAVAAAVRLGFPVVMKLVSSDVVHKTDVGGVRLNVTDAEAVRATYDDILQTVATALPDAGIDGVLIQQMHRGGVEMIAGGTRDLVFGPLVMFGLGGVFVEALHDVAFRVAPLTATDAHELIRAIRGQKLLDGFRGTDAVDRTAVAHVLQRLSRLMGEHPAIGELDINPLVADATGVVALDARVSIDVG